MTGGRVGVFAYGSLVDPSSAARTLGRPVRQPRPARLVGWRRRFSTARDNVRSEKTFAREHDGWVPPAVLVLNVEPATGEGAEPPNGVVIPVTSEELALLDRRELRYARVEVTGCVDEVASDVDHVFTYVADEEHRAVEPPAGAVVLQAYAQAVEDAFASWGDEHLDTYRSTTLPYPAPLMAGRLVRDRIPSGNPRGW